MAALDLTHRELFREIRAFLLGLFPDAGAQIVQAIQNNQPLPENAIVMTFLFDSDLDYGVVTYDPANEQAGVQNSVEARLQLDFYGPQAESRSRVVDTLWRTFYGADNLGICKPLYVQSRQRQPYVNDSNQYEDRYVLDLALQYNPQVIYAQDFTESADVTINP